MQQQQQQQQQPKQHNERRFYQQRLHGGPVAYEEKTRVINFAPEDEQDDQALVTPRPHKSQPWTPERLSERHSVGVSDSRDFDPKDDNNDDGRHRSRVKTRPVLGTRAADLSAIREQRPQQEYYHRAVRTRPVSAAPSVSTYTNPYYENQLYQDHRTISQQVPQQAVMQSPVAKRVAAGKQRKQQKQQQQQQQQQPSASDGEWTRSRASSESTFGGRLFFGWRRAQYGASTEQQQQQQQQPGNGFATSLQPEAQASQYQGKNLHNFSYTDAKIYSPQSYYQQKEQLQQKQQFQQKEQQQQQQQQQQQKHRANIWWTMETMGAVNSAHSNQMLLARSARHPQAVQGDQC